MTKSIVNGVEIYGWFSPAVLKYINENHATSSLLYELGMLLEEISARVRSYVNDERERCAKIAESMVIEGHAVQAPSCAAIAKKIREL